MHVRACVLGTSCLRLARKAMEAARGSVRRQFDGARVLNRHA